MYCTFYAINICDVMLTKESTDTHINTHARTHTHIVQSPSN